MNLKLLFIGLFISLSMCAQIVEQNDKTVQPAGNLDQNKSKSLVSVGLTLGTTWNRDTSFTNYNRKKSIANYQFLFFIGAQSAKFKPYASVDFSMTDLDTTEYLKNKGNISSKLISFQTQLGLRTYFMEMNPRKINVFVEGSWVHGVHTFVLDHYKNEYNGLHLGLGVQKSVTPKNVLLTASLAYENCQSNHDSAIKYGFTNMDNVSVKVGFIF